MVCDPAARTGAGLHATLPSLRSSRNSSANTGTELPLSTSRFSTPLYCLTTTFVICLTLRCGTPFSRIPRCSRGSFRCFLVCLQSAEAAAVGLTLRPTTLLIFGDPSRGTPLMEAYPTLAVDLPLKALVWELSPSEVYISLTSPEFLQKRHNLPSAPFSEVIRLFVALINAQAQ
jgi:uncharacterized protein (DUF302 family)